MDMQIAKARAYELINFLKVAPKEIPEAKNNFKVSKFRLALEKALQDYRKPFDEYQKKYNEELAPFNEQLQQMAMSGADQVALGLKKQELDLQLNLLMKPAQEELNRIAEEDGKTVIAVTVNEEDRNQAAIYFQKIVGDSTKGANYWLQGDAYLEVAAALGCLQDA